MEQEAVGTGMVHTAGAGIGADIGEDMGSDNRGAEVELVDYLVKDNSNDCSAVAVVGLVFDLDLQGCSLSLLSVIPLLWPSL